MMLEHEPFLILRKEKKHMDIQGERVTRRPLFSVISSSSSPCIDTRYQIPELYAPRLPRSVEAVDEECSWQL